MLEIIKKEIMTNSFVDDVCIKMDFNESEYRKLILNLKEAAIALKKEVVIDKELALYLYTIPQMIRNACASFDGKDIKPKISIILEDAWIELDALVVDCLT
ncbi:hypothetical protein [Kosakonia sp.]|uniref:hypothetical protein n=1 Tax=Kosakonia sp. TaxID=1916651 RepID=UPI0028A178C3|nr:hypothetical protein [Kosakonia sp.]